MSQNDGRNSPDQMSPIFASARRYTLIVPSDVTKQYFHGLFVGVAGNIRVVNQYGDDVVFPNVPVGFAPIAGEKVMNTNTTATNMVGLTW